MMYWGQGGIERDMDQAFEMQQAAAMQNHPDALFDAGVMTLKGQGTSKNVSLSIFWFCFSVNNITDELF